MKIQKQVLDGMVAFVKAEWPTCATLSQVQNRLVGEFRHFLPERHDECDMVTWHVMEQAIPNIYEVDASESFAYDACEDDALSFVY